MPPDICAICNSPRSDSAGPCSVCGAPPSAPTRNLPAGTHLQNGRFTLGRVLGEGGFGITYLGAHRYLKRTVAIKELFPERAMRHGTTVSVPDSQQREFHIEKERVLEEARAITRLDSPYIVEVQDAFLENNTAYIVMEYLEGESLQERIDAVGALPRDDVHRIAMAVCDALTEVHRHDLLHRDIKPANIMLTRDGRVVLVDFGAARVFDQGQTVRHTRILDIGYAAPEMYSTQARFGPYTDLFCLGGTLFHALTGSPPPSVRDLLQDGRVDLEFPNALHGSLGTAIRQALQVAVKDRPQSAQAFKSAFLGSVVPIAEDKPASTPPPKPQSNPTAVILRDTIHGHTAAVSSVVFHPKELTLASGGNDQTVRLWDTATCTLLQTLWGHKDAVHSLAFSPDGRILASGSADGFVRLWDIAKGTPWKTPGGHEDRIHSVTFSPNGRILASGGADRTVRLWDPDSGTFLQTLWGHVDRVFSVAFSPNGRILASGGADRTIRLWDVDAETLRHTLKNPKGSVFSVAFSPDGQTLASGGEDGFVRIWNATTGTCLQTLKLRTGGVNSLAFSPDGRTLAISSFHLCLWDATAGTLRQTLASQTDRIYSVSFSPDGQTLASGSADMVVRLWE